CQSDDGIRDRNVTGVQTCALPIFSEKQQVLARFTSLCCHHVSGRRKAFSLLSLAENLEHKAQWLSEYIRKQEWIQAGQGEGWFKIGRASSREERKSEVLEEESEKI